MERSWFQCFFFFLFFFSAFTLSEMKSRLNEWRKDLKNATRFRSFYDYVFEYLREDKKIICQKKKNFLFFESLYLIFPSQKKTAIEEAKTVWEMLKMGERWPLWKKFIDFTESKTKAINKDTWKLIGRFIEQHPKDLNNYDANGCWPLLLDEFVEHVRNEGNSKKESTD